MKRTFKVLMLTLVILSIWICPSKIDTNFIIATVWSGMLSMCLASLFLSSRNKTTPPLKIKIPFLETDYLNISTYQFIALVGITGSAIFLLFKPSLATQKIKIQLQETQECFKSLDIDELSIWIDEFRIPTDNIRIDGRDLIVQITNKYVLDSILVNVNIHKIECPFVGEAEKKISWYEFNLATVNVKPTSACNFFLKKHEESVKKIEADIRELPNNSSRMDIYLRLNTIYQDIENRMESHKDSCQFGLQLLLKQMDRSLKSIEEKI